MRKDRKTGRRTYEAGDGVRRRFHDALDPTRYEFPRKGLVHHPRSWYLSEAPTRRPVFGVYAMASFAEDMLWRAKFGKAGRIPRIEDALPFFSATRAALQNTLSTYRIDRRLTAKETETLRRVVARLVVRARKFVARMDEDFAKRNKETTCCLIKKRVTSTRVK